MYCQKLLRRARTFYHEKNRLLNGLYNRDTFQARCVNDFNLSSVVHIVEN